MKTILLIFLLSVSIQLASSQDSARERIAQRRQAEANLNTSKQKSYNNNSNYKLNEILVNSRWSRIIYRYINLSNSENSPLYYPKTPIDGRVNLFTMIFKSLQNNQIKAYEYLDGREVFTEEYLINFTEFIDRFGIYHEDNNGTILVNDADVPSNEVQGYYLKEVYYFDTPTSSFNVQPIAICPIMHREDNYESSTRYPLFWVPYSEIEHQLRTMPVMSSSINNSVRGTVDDFFRSRLYYGEIYKAGNPGNQSISQYTNSPEEMEAEQNRIEQELIDFEDRLSKEQVMYLQQNNQNNKNQNRKINVRAKGSNYGATQSMRSRRY